MTRVIHEDFLVNIRLTIVCYSCHGWFLLEPDVGQDGSLTRIEQRVFVSHGPLWTHVTNLLISVISRTDNHLLFDQYCETSLVLASL